MKAEQLLALLREIEQEDPIDFSGLPFEAADLRHLACLNVVELINSWPADATPEEKDLVMAATVTRLVLENMVLQIRVAILAQDATD
jgi:hypothetical protein